MELHLAERRASLADANAEFAEQLSAIAQRQLDAGEINLLVYNTAVLEAARARSQAERFAGRRRAAGALLGSLLALPPDSSVTTSALPALPVLPTTSPELQADLAFDRRPDLAAATMELEAADKVFGAERRRFIPNLELALFTGQEGETDDLLGFSFGLSVPLFRRGQSERGSARSDQAAAEAVSSGTIRAIRVEVKAGLATYAGAYNAERRFADDLLRSGAENAELAARAFAEGELSITEVVVFRTTALATQLEYVEVLADAYTAWFELAAAFAATPQELTELLGGA
jgi:outer membrane protein TolC